MYVLTGTFAGRYHRFPLKPGRNSLGRGSRNDLDLDHNSVSREHAEIEVDDDTIVLRDLNSSNGTFVNGKRVEGSVEIRHRDVISFGAQDLTLQKSGMTDTDEPSPPKVIHDTVLALSEPDSINEQETMSWDEATGDVGPSNMLDPTLYRVLTELGHQMILPRPLAETLDLLLGMVERAITARRLLLLLTDTPDKQPVVRAARPSMAHAGEKAVLSRSIIGKVLEERRALHLNDAQSDPNFRAQQSIIMQNIRSAMVAPLFDTKEVIGLLYADSDDPSIRYDRNQLRAFTLMANLIAVKITNARLLDVQREKERLADEAEAAARVQVKLLPGKLPALDNYEVVAQLNSCYECAGDLYDVHQLNDGRLAIVLGDVTGKGMGAAMLMSLVMSGLRMQYDNLPPLDVLAEQLHRQLLDHSDPMHFVTLFLGVLEPETGRMEYINAGHNPPMLLLPDEPPQTLDTTGMPLGLMPGATYHIASATLPSQSLLCVFSDGIPEAMVEDEFYGEERFLESARQRCHQPLEEVIDGAFADLRKFVGDAPLEDDATLLLLRRCSKAGEAAEAGEIATP